MIPITGKDVILQFFDGSDYLDFACITECSIEWNTEMREVRTINGGRSREIRPKKDSGVVNMSGIVVLDGGRFKAFDLLQEYQLQWLPIPWQMVFDSPETGLEKIVRARSYIERTMLTGPTNGHSIGDFTMPIDGDIEVIDSATVCGATIGELTAGFDPDSSNTTIHYIDVIDAARLEYSVDGGDRIPLISPGSDGFIFIPGLADGVHTVQVWTVCENGIDGEDNSVTFPVSGGEPGPTCEVPGTPIMSDLTGTTATATWTAPDSPPSGGYFWQVITPLGAVLSSGNTVDIFTNLTGLTNGIDYTFKVKSLCEEGVSESSYQSVVFTSSPACALPGTPSMSSVADTTATASWSAASPTPADGYEWEVLDGITVIASGATASTNVNITGLTANTDYTFQVKSICETGVSESGFVTVDFTTEAASCANPGPVLVSTFGMDPGEATASWSAASPSPADGYAWNLIRISDSVLIDSGTTAALLVNLTGLTSAETYQFQVQSVCETGVSYSGFRTRNFTMP